MTQPIINAKIRFQGLDEIKASFASISADFERAADRMSDAGKKVGDGLSKSVGVANTTLRTTGTVGVRSFGLMKNAVGGLTTIIKTSSSMVTELGKAAVNASGKIATLGVGAVAAVNGFGIKVGSSISEMGKLARAAGVSTETFSRLASATRLAGGSVTDITTGLQSLSDRIIDASKGGASEAYFKQIGVSVRDLNGEIKSTDQILDEVADGLKAIPKDNLRASAAVDLFGTSATKLLPILEDGAEGLRKYSAQADQYGTTVTEAQSKQASDLIAKSRKVREALIGISYKVGDALLPQLTKNSEKTAAFLAKSGDRIAKIVGDAAANITSLSADIARAFMGDIGKIERGWVRKLVPALSTVKDVLADVLDIIGGKTATRATWLNDVWKALNSASAAAWSLAQAIVAAAGYGESQFPTLAEIAATVAVAFDNLRQGMSGEKGEYSMPWAGKIGETIRSLGIAVGAVAGVIVNYRDEIATAVAFIASAFSDLVVAVATLLNGDQIAKENPFAFLGPIADWVKQHRDTIVNLFKNLPNDIVVAVTTVKDIFVAFYKGLDAVAKALGLDSGVQLGLVFLILHLTKATAIFQTIATAISTTLFIVNGFAGVLRSVGQLIFSAIIPALTWLTTLFVGATAPMWVMIGAATAIAVAIAGIGYVVYQFRDEVWAVLKWVFGTLWSAMKGIVQTILHPVETFKSAIRSIAEWFGLIDPVEISKPFEEAGDRILDASGKTVERVEKDHAAMEKAAADSRQEMEKAFGTIKDKGSEAFGGVTENVKELKAEISTAATESTSKWDAMFASGKDAASGATASMGDQLRKLQQQYGLTGEQMKTSAMDTTSKVSEQLADLRKEYGLTSEQMGAAISDTVGVMDEKQIAAIKAAQDRMSSLDVSLPDLSMPTSLGTAGLDDAKKKLDELVKSGAKLPEGLGGTLKTSFGDVKDATADAVDSAKEAMAEMPDTFADFGDRARDALTDGMEKAGTAADYVETQTAKAVASMKTMWDSSDEYQAAAFEKTKSTWSRMTDFFREQVDATRIVFHGLWRSFDLAPALAYSDVTDSFEGLFPYFDDLATQIGDRFRALWRAITAEASDAVGRISETIPSFGTQGSIGSADKSPRLATGGIIRGPGGPVGDKIRAWLSSGEGVVNARAVTHYGENFIHGLNNLMIPRTHFATGGIAGQMVPASSGMENMGSWNLALGGQRIGQVFAERDAVRAVNRAMNRSAAASRGPAARWKRS